MLKNVLKNYSGYDRLTIINANKHKVHFNGCYDVFFEFGKNPDYISWWKALMSAHVVSKQTVGHEYDMGSNIIVWVDFEF